MARRMLFIGLRAPAYLPEGSLHVPFICVKPITCPHLKGLCCNLEMYTHILFTSQSAVQFFLEHFHTLPRFLPTLYSVGQATSRFLHTFGYRVAHCALEETAEGVIALLQETMDSSGHLFWPHSEQARPILGQYLETAPFRSTTAVLYRTINKHPDPLPDLTAFEGVLFTSPSTVHAFFAFYCKMPAWITCFAIGPVTAAVLRDYGVKSMEGKQFR